MDLVDDIKAMLQPLDNKEVEDTISIATNPINNEDDAPSIMSTHNSHQRSNK